MGVDGVKKIAYSINSLIINAAGYLNSYENFNLILVNARHVKNVPGRKTDIKDSEWLCKLLKNGLLEHNFIPPEEIRNLRDLTRYRAKLVATMASEKNRIIKILETANIKLASVLSDVFGETGSRIVEDLAHGRTDPKNLVKHIAGNVKHSREDFIRALTGRITRHHSFLIRQALDHICDITKIVRRLEVEIETITSSYANEFDLLQTVPGVSSTAAAAIMAEIGTNMDAMCEFRFSLYGLCFSRAFYHVASWRKRRKFAHRVQYEQNANDQKSKKED
jgi:transposase